VREEYLFGRLNCIQKDLKKAKRVALHLEASLVILHQLAMEIQNMEGRAKNKEL
jgi:hypothetical protein